MGVDSGTGWWFGDCESAAWIDRDSCCLSLNIAPSLYGFFFMWLVLGCDSYAWAIFYILTGSVTFIYIVYVASNDGEPCLAFGLTIQAICVLLASVALWRRCSHRRRGQTADGGPAAADASPMEVLSSDFEAAAAATSRRLACVQSMLTPRGGSGSGGGGGGSGGGTPRSAVGGVTPRGGPTPRSGLTPRSSGVYMRTPRECAGATEYHLPSHRQGELELAPSPRQWQESGSSQQYVYGASGRTAFGVGGGPPPLSHHSAGCASHRAGSSEYNPRAMQQVAALHAMQQQQQQRRRQQQLHAQHLLAQQMAHLTPQQQQQVLIAQQLQAQVQAQQQQQLQAQQQHEAAELQHAALQHAVMQQQVIAMETARAQAMGAHVGDASLGDSCQYVCDGVPPHTLPTACNTSCNTYDRPVSPGNSPGMSDGGGEMLSAWMQYAAAPGDWSGDAEAEYPKKGDDVHFV